MREERVPVKWALEAFGLLSLPSRGGLLRLGQLAEEIKRATEDGFALGGLVLPSDGSIPFSDAGRVLAALTVALELLLARRVAILSFNAR